MKARIRTSWRDRHTEKVETWYRPGVSIQQFHDSQAFVRVLVGGRGSQKTTACAVEAIRHCTHYAGAKVLAVRQTQVSNEDTSVRTFNEVYDRCGYRIQEDEETSLFRKWNDGLTVRIPSADALTAYNELMRTNPTRQQIKTWIDNDGDRLCSYIEFRGLKDENKVEGQLRGYECSMGILVEADLLQEQDLDLFVACLRWKDAYGNYIPDYSIILDTNPPSPRHWIAKMEVRVQEDPTYRYWHIKTEENINLPPGYIASLERQYRNKPAHRRRYLLGEYAELFEGSPVLFAFREDKHAFEDIPWPSGAYLIRGWDFGSIHAVIWSAYFKVDFQVGKLVVPVEYWWDMHEYFNEMSDTERQSRAVIDITDREFPFWNDRSVCAGVLDYCDPAGAARTDKGSSVAVVQSNIPGIVMNWQTRVRSLDTTISVYNRLLEMRDPAGRFVYKLDKKWCPRLYAASLGEYRWPLPGEAGYTSGEPIKGPKCNGADHLVDASRYPKINCLRLAQRVFDEVTKKNIQPGGKPKSLNRPKRDY